MQVWLEKLNICAIGTRVGPTNPRTRIWIAWSVSPISQFSEIRLALFVLELATSLRPSMHLHRCHSTRTSAIPCFGAPHLSRLTLGSRRLYTELASPKTSSGHHTVQLAPGQDEAAVMSKLNVLLAGAQDMPSQPWHLALDGKGIHRHFKFQTFNKTWVCQNQSSHPSQDLKFYHKSFMQIVAEKCKTERHHPEWTNVRLCCPDPLQDLC